MLPQVGLTIYYLGEIRTTASLIEENSTYIDALAQLQQEASVLVLPEPDAISDSALERHTQSLQALREHIQASLRVMPKFQETKKQLTLAVSDLAVSAERWSAAVARARESAPDAAAFLRLVKFPEESGSDIMNLARQYHVRRMELSERFIAFTSDAAQSLRAEREYTTKLVEHADRNLITLTMLVFIFIAVLFVVLPENLVRPLREMTRGIRDVGRGHMSARLSTGEHDELGALARAFNDMMEVLEDFDSRKRDRIVADGGRLDGALRAISNPAAVLTPNFIVEASNPAFRTLFSLSSADEERPLPNVLDAGRREFREILEKAIGRREPLSNVQVSLSSGGKRTSHLLSAQPCRDRRGRTVGMVISLAAS